jgi:uncharacterized membrane protein
MQNFHPLFVHFPVAFLAAALVAEALYVARRRRALDAFARWLLYLGTAAAAATVLSGWLGLQTVARVRAAHDALAAHERLGYLVLGTSAVLAFWRAGTGPRGGPAPRWLFLLGLAGLLGLVVRTAQLGGALVYEHGVGTALTAPGGPLAEEPDTTAGRRPPAGDEFR